MSEPTHPPTHTHMHMHTRRLKDSTRCCDRMTRAHKHTADSLIGVATYLALLSIGKDDPLSSLYKKTSDSFEKIRVSVCACVCVGVVYALLCVVRNWKVEWRRMRI